jgi:hypothetical protein
MAAFSKLSVTGLPGWAKTIFVLAGVVSAAIWLFRVGWLEVPLVLGQRRTALGGPWILIDESSTLGHGSTRQRVVWQVGPFVRTVGENVGAFVLLDEDCLLFEQVPEDEREVDVVCGMGVQRRLYKGTGRLRLDPDAMRVESFVDGEIQTILKLGFSEVVAKGRAK